MWFLKDAAGNITYLWPNKTLIVSRKQGDLILERDESISRKHASITIKPKSEIRFLKKLLKFEKHASDRDYTFRGRQKGDEPTSTCIIQDIGSKYGSFILEEDGQRRITTEGCSINPSNKVKFGLQQHIFEFHYVPIIVTTSTLSLDDKNELHNIMNTVDGLIIPDWKDSCTHLTVANVTLTVKVACALASGIPIVNMAYWRTVLGAMEGKQTLPKPENFTPTISEGNIDGESVSLATNIKRKTLFKDLIFVCFSGQQFRCYSTMIKSAGGRLILYDRKPLTTQELCARNVVVIQFASDSSQLVQTPSVVYESIQEALQTNRRRMIPESEVPLAILYCSIAQKCNPRFAYAQLFNVRNQPHDNAKNSVVLAVDTQDLEPPQRPVPIMINETLASQQPSTQNSTITNPSTEKKTVLINESSQSFGEFDSLPREGVPMKTLQRNVIDTEHPQASTSGTNGNRQKLSKNIPKNKVIIINETVEDSEPSEYITKRTSAEKSPQVPIQLKDRSSDGARRDSSTFKNDVRKRERSDHDDEIVTVSKKAHLESENENPRVAGSSMMQQLKNEAGQAKKSYLDLDADVSSKSSENSNKKYTGKPKVRESTGKLTNEVDSDPEAIKIQLPSDEKFVKPRVANPTSIQSKPAKSSWLDIDEETVKKPSESNNSNTSKRSSKSAFSDFENSLNKPSTSKASTEKQLKMTTSLELVSDDKRPGASNVKKSTPAQRRISSKSFPIEDDGWIVPKANTPNRTLNSTSSVESRKSDPRTEKEEDSEDDEDQFGFVNEQPKGQVEKKDDDDPWAFIDDPNAKSDSDECPFGIDIDKYKTETKESKDKIREKKKKRRHRSSSSEHSFGHADDKQLGQSDKLMKSDGDAEVTETFKCKANDTMAHNCTSTITPLLRTDIDIDLDCTETKVKMFIKVYEKTPAKRVKLEDMYVWKSEKIIDLDGALKNEPPDSSEEEADDFNFTNSKVGINKRATKTRARVRA